MSAIFELIVPIFLMAALGWQAARSQVLTEPMVQGLSRFLSIYALPALLFSALVRAGFPDAIEWGFLASFYGSALGIFAVGLLFQRRVSSRRPDLAAAGFASSFSNIGVLGVPLMLNAYGPAGVMPLLLLLPFQTPLLLTTATVLAESDRSEGGGILSALGRIARNTALNPMIWGVLAGLVVNRYGIPVPDVCLKTTNLLGQALLPCSSFAIGASLALSPIRGHVGQALPISMLKVGVHPVLTWVLASSVFGLPAEWLSPAVVSAALPTGVAAYAFSNRYQACDEVVSMSILLTTILAPISISTAYLLTH